MLKLTGGERPPVTIDCRNGVTLTVLASTSALRSAARRAASAALAAADGDGIFYDYFVPALAQRAITGWTGVGDAEGAPVEPTADRIAELFDVSDSVYRAFEVEYVTPLLELDAEKNASSAAPVGTSPKAGRTTAKGAAKASAPSARSSRMLR